MINYLRCYTCNTSASRDLTASHRANIYISYLTTTHMKRIYVILLLITIGCIAQKPPHFGECLPEDVVLSVNQEETIAFSCVASDPDTEELEYTWYVNGEEVSDNQWYNFTMDAGEYTVSLEVSDGTTIISRQWNVTVLGSPNFEKVQNRLERIRGLKFLEPVNRIVIDRTQLRQNLMIDLEEDREDIEIEKNIYVALHVMEPGTDLYQVYIDLLTTQVASYYDTEDHTFYEVVDPDEPVIYREFIAAHEFVHALQDQYHYLDHEFDNDDEQLAFLCVVEGDAVFHQYMYLDEMTSMETRNLFTYIGNLDIPVVNVLLENLIMLRYDLGLKFVVEMSISGIDNLYEKLPLSTEQVMHPEKYRTYERPILVEIPSIPGWEQLAHNVLGEAVLQTILKEHIDVQTAAEAAQGWGGDSYGYYEKGDNYLFLMNTFWDTQEDAAEFFEAYYDFTLSWSEENIEKISENMYETPTGFLALVQRGNQVFIAESPSLEAVTEALSTLTVNLQLIV